MMSMDAHVQLIQQQTLLLYNMFCIYKLHKLSIIY